VAVGSPDLRETVGVSAIVDRDDERAAIQQLIADARNGLSGAALLHGDAGIGKTVLLENAIASAPDLRLLRTVGVQAEALYPFAVLHRLLLPFLDRMDALPAPQRNALNVAFGLGDGPAADSFMVGLGALSLVSEAARPGPLLICVDDTQWVDQESLGALGFIARRVHAEGVVVLLAARAGAGDLAALDGLDVIRIEGLGPGDALELLLSVIDEAIDPLVADRVVEATGGNPLGLTDLGAELSSIAELGSPYLVEPMPLGGQLESHYLEQVRSLPDQTQLWLTLASAEPTGDLECIARAAGALGIDDDAAVPAERAEVVQIRSAVQFRHPLVRSAIYGGATRFDRIRVHRALADALVQPDDVDRRTWHLAAACDGPDETVAGELEKSAERFLGKGGFAASSNILARAAELTPVEAARARRLLAAADAAAKGGVPLQARVLLGQIDRGAIDDTSNGRLQLLQADLNVQTGQPDAFSGAPAACVAAAELLASFDRDLARSALLRACEHVITAEHLIAGTTPAEIARAIDAIPPGPNEPAEASLILSAFAAMASGDYVEAVPHAQRAVSALLEPDRSDIDVVARYLLGVTFCMSTWDIVSQTAILERANESARRIGALRDLETILFCQSMAATGQGKLEAADLYLIEGHQMRSALGANAEQWEIYRHPELLAWHGGDDQLPETLRQTVEASISLGIGATASIASIAQTVLDLGNGDYGSACVVARGLVENDALGVHSRVLPYLVEAAVRAGDRRLAQQALNTMSSRATASGTPWALGLLARCQALVDPSDEAAARYREAIEIIEQLDLPLDLAHSHLLYGEWLRRRKLRSAGREQLRIAHTMFSDIGAGGFTERARLELAATGERARKRTEDTLTDLTPHELQIAKLAAAGHTNVEIGQKLFISSRTVDYHLRKVFRKLDIGSRRQLRGRFD
jgi:DNA-binding CsgD family transcriptional regulator/tetratricopeptide (TPR) repeat protein